MKIVHISHLYYPSAGGVQTYFKNVSERLVRDYGDDVTVVTTDSYFGPEKSFFKKITPSHETINGVKVIRFHYRRWHIKPLKLVVKMLRKLGLAVPEEIIMQLNGPCSTSMKNYLTNVKADAFFASSSNYYFMQLPLWRKCNFFYFASIHLDEEIGKTHLLNKQLECMNASTLYIANTHFEQQRMIQFGVDPQKTFVLGCGVEMSDFEMKDKSAVLHFKNEIGIPENALVAGYVGRIEKTKNVHLVIEAFTKIQEKHSATYLLIAGTGGQYVHELKLICKQLPDGVSSRIKFLTEFDQSKKAALFNSLDVLVLPSKNESFGLVFLEAWSCRKPVIGASIGAVRDVVTDGHDGLIVLPDDANDLADKMSTLLSDKNLRERLGENGFIKVKERYTWDIIVSKLRNCYTRASEIKDNKSQDIKYV